MKWLKLILDWSEVWATLIPLIVYFWVKPKTSWVKPLLIYLVLALLLALVVDVTWKFGTKDWVKDTFWWLFRDGELYTLIFYNINSFLRLILLTWFFYLINPSHRKIYGVLSSVFMVAAVVNFIFFEDIFLSFSSRLLTAEAAIILVYCLLYYYTVNMDDEIESPMALPPFWVVMGLTLYTSVNFLIFLFYHYLITAEEKYAIDIWSVHNISYLVLMLFIAIAFKKTK